MASTYPAWLGALRGRFYTHAKRQKAVVNRVY